MTTNLPWTVFWPSQLKTPHLLGLLNAQTEMENSQILITNDQPMTVFRKNLLGKPQLVSCLLLKMELKIDFSDKKYRLQFQDELCFLADQYCLEHASKMNLLFIPQYIPENSEDFNKYLMDSQFFFKERFALKFKQIAISVELNNYTLNDHIHLLKLGVKSNICGLAYSPLYFEKMGVDSLKTSFIWKPYVNTIYLSDVDFDGKTPVSPGFGIIPNQSICQIALEKNQEISFIFRPNFEMISSQVSAINYLKNCDIFIRKLP